jgi:hypothetical protein
MPNKCDIRDKYVAYFCGRINKWVGVETNKSIYGWIVGRTDRWTDDLLSRFIALGLI